MWKELRISRLYSIVRMPQHSSSSCFSSQLPTFLEIVFADENFSGKKNIYIAMTQSDKRDIVRSMQVIQFPESIPSLCLLLWRCKGKQVTSCRASKYSQKCMLQRTNVQSTSDVVNSCCNVHLGKAKDFSEHIYRGIRLEMSFATQKKTAEQKKSEQEAIFFKKF